jgi:cobalt/nickel transport system ATP-binding protein
MVFVGAMGKKSKTLAEKNGIQLDVTSGVIDKSILMALCGKRCLLLAAGGMVRSCSEKDKRIRGKKWDRIYYEYCQPRRKLQMA